MIYELECRYDSRRSFYGKAKIRVCEESDKIQHLELLSYGTLVANYVYYKNEDKKVYECFGKYSQTTTRHQKEFFRQAGLTDKEIKKLFVEGVIQKCL